MNKSERPNCELCGEPMPQGEEMFNYHGYSGNCPKPPLAPKPRTARARIDGGKLSDEKARELLFYLIGFFQLEENPRFDRAIEIFFDDQRAERTRCEFSRLNFRIAEGKVDE
jgi:hypothetical protein